ncbi:MAG: 3-oxoacyl-[acyl-carrier-protein] reductase [Chloroflexota bacterium]
MTRATLEDRVAVITGASGALGSAAALRLAELGARVVANYHRDDAGALRCVAAIRESGGEGEPAQADVSTPAGADAIVKFALERFGRVDILVNNAGITRDGLALRMSEDDWDAVLDTNLKGAFLCAKAVLRPMLRQRWGRIVNVTSVAGLMGNPGQVNYSAAKAGMIGLTKSLAREVASRSVTVNAVAPGYIPSAIWDGVGDEARDAILRQVPMGRPGTPAEVAAAIAFFASEEASYVTGQVLAIDGGLV